MDNHVGGGSQGCCNNVAAIEYASQSNGLQPKEEKVHLQRTLTVWNSCSVILGVMIGSGIFVSPQGVLQQAGSIGASLVVWTICGLLVLLGALCFAELGTSIKTSGGEYTYIKLAYGPLLSFLYLWLLVIVILPCSSAISALTFANYVLQPFYQAHMGCKPDEQAIRLLALAIILLLAFINCASVKGSIRMQNSFTFAKVLSLCLIVSYGLYYIITGQAENFATSEAIWAETETSLPHLARAFYAAFYTYSGWNSLNCVTEEIRDPVKNIPRAIILSIITITLIYILTNAAYFAVLSRQEILDSSAIAVVFGNKSLHQFASWLMPLLVALSTMGGLNGSIFASSRILFAGSRTGQLFSALHMIQLDYLTPVPAIIFLASISSVYLFTTKILTLIDYVTFVEASFAALGVSTVLRLRQKLPDLARPLRIHWSIPVLYLLFSILLITLPIYTAPLEAMIGISIILSGIPVYYLTADWKQKPRSYQQAIDRFNILIQKLTMSVIPDSEMDLIL